MSLWAENRQNFAVGDPEYHIPRPDLSSYNYHINATGVQLLGLNDLFNSKTPYKDAIRDACLVPLNAFDGGYNEWGFYKCSATSITIDGEKIPYALLKAYLNPSGPLVAFAEHAPTKRSEEVRDGVTGLTIEAAMKLGHDAYMARHTAMRKQKDIDYDYYHRYTDAYARIVHTYNLWQAASLPVWEHNVYLQVRRSCERLAFNRYDAEAYRTGDYPTLAEYQNAILREEMLSAVITALRKWRTAGSRNRRFLSTAETQVQQLLTASSKDPMYEHSYRDLVGGMNKTLDDMLKVIWMGSWPDEVCKLVGDYATQTTKPLEEAK